MTKVNDLEFNPKMSVDDFIEANMGHFEQEWLEKNPEYAYKINDWDVGQVYDDLNPWEVADFMAEIYREYLFINYSV